MPRKEIDLTTAVVVEEGLVLVDYGDTSPPRKELTNDSHFAAAAAVS